MTSFNFKPVQILELTASDSPTIDVQEGQLILKAERNGEQIHIIAPLQNVLPQPKATVVRKPFRAGKPLKKGGDKRAGELNGMAKLTAAKVREIRLLLSDDKFVNSFPSNHALYMKLAETYNVHIATMRNVVRFESWKNVTI